MQREQGVEQRLELRAALVADPVEVAHLALAADHGPQMDIGAPLAIGLPGLTEPEARARVAAQMDEAARLRRADVVIQNEGDLESLRAQVQEAWAALQRRLERRAGPGAEPDGVP